MKAPELLRRAAEIMDERGKQYDKPDGERSMGRAVAAFNAITGRELTESEGWLLLQVLKDVRQWQNPNKAHQDSLEDCIAYAALKAESMLDGAQPCAVINVAGKPDADGWMDWHGEECPLPIDCFCDMQFRNGDKISGYPDHFTWSQDPDLCDEEFQIIKYRIHKEQ